MNRKIWLEDIFPLISEQLNSGGSASFTIRGTSMLPMLKDGIDSVRIIKPIATPKKYDIIFYRRDDGTFILHRIVGIKDGDYICRGDNQTENEFPVKNGSIIGIVAEYTKNGKVIKFDSIRQTVYSRFVVNTVLLKKFLRILISKARKLKNSFTKESSSK